MTFREDIKFQGCVHSSAIVDTKQLLREGQGRVLLPGHTRGPCIRAASPLPTSGLTIPALPTRRDPGRWEGTNTDPRYHPQPLVDNPVGAGAFVNSELWNQNRTGYPDTGVKRRGPKTSAWVCPALEP